MSGLVRKARTFVNGRVVNKDKLSILKLVKYERVKIPEPSPVYQKLNKNYKN